MENDFKMSTYYKANESLTYYALHYHAKSSGVKVVIDNIFKALRRYSNYKLNLIYSADDQVYRSESVNCIDIPEVGYNGRCFESVEIFDHEAKILKSKIKSKLDLSHKCIIHAHNLNLMKNPILTRAIKFLSEDQELKDRLGIILQVHDFAEDNRRKLLHLMQNVTGKIDNKFASLLAYPVARNIVYCTINNRDKLLLEKSGMNKTVLFPNNIDCESLSNYSFSSTNDGLYQRLENYAANYNYKFEKRRKILLSPVKVMKRKNIIETLLILTQLNIVKDEYQLLITLDANSAEDKIYSHQIKKFIKKYNLAVTIGFGHDFISPNGVRSERYPYTLIDLFKISNIIVTTSIQEGFGMTYLEGWVANKPVIGRRMDIVFQDFEKHGIDLDHFYNEILIAGVDFKDYPEEKQFEILENTTDVIDDSNLKKVIEFIQNPCESKISTNKRVIEKEYGLVAYSNILQQMASLCFANVPATAFDNVFLIDYFQNYSK